MNNVYVIRTQGRLGLLLGKPDPGHYVAGPFATVDDAEIDLKGRWVREESRRGAVGAVILAFAVLAWFYALPMIVGDRFDRPVDPGEKSHAQQLRG